MYLGPIVPRPANAPPAAAQAPVAPLAPAAASPAVEEAATAPVARRYYFIDRRKRDRRQQAGRALLDTRDGSDRRQSPRGSIDIVV